MAIAQGDGSIVLTTKVDESGMKKGFSSMTNMAKKTASTVGKAFAAISVAASAAIVAITKQAVEAYAEYEQLVGGVETLFKDSAEKVKSYAMEAFRTTGLSANEYMKQVTSFSASLIRSTANDTEKAADIANMALIDISDNVNKMGSSMESVTLAYQGFAKQQYQLLDNLKLGYGGTKTEMERLLADAEALTGIKYDINNLADVYSAIHAIQEQLSITGTTAKEAEKTISGSAATTKAAWQNVLTAISGGGDLDRAIDNLVDSISNLFNNIVPVVERSLQGIGRLIERVAPQLVQSVAKSLIQAIPSLLDAVYEMIVGLAKGIYQGVMALFYGEAIDSVKEQAEAIAGATANQKNLTDAVKETNKELKGALAGFDELNTLSKPEDSTESLGGFGGSVQGNTMQVEVETEIKEPSKLQSVLKGIIAKIQKIFEPVTNSFKKLFKPLAEGAKSVWAEMKPFGQWVTDSLAPAFAETLSEGIDLAKVSIDELGDNMSDFWENTGSSIVSDIGEMITAIIEFFGNAFDYFGEKLKDYEKEIDLFTELIGGIIGIIWGLLKPFIELVGALLSNSFKNVTDGLFSIMSVFSNIFGFIKNIVLGIVELFKGNFDEAGEYFKSGLKMFVNVFVSIGNLIISVVNELWALIFNAFKGGVNAVGGVIEEVGSWFGADWDLHWDASVPRIPEIPYLAQGAVIPGGREFLAVLGDQPKGQTNIEAPLDTIKQALAEVMSEFGGNGNNQPIIIEIDGKEVFRAVRNAETRYGSRLVTGGV